MHTANLLISVLFGSLGVGFFIYGRRRQELVPLVSGLILSVYPFFVSRLIWLLLIGLVAAAAPFLIDI